MIATQSLHANGKILLTGEYLVMMGAIALAIPLVPGQKLVINQSQVAGQLSWKSYDPEGIWFEGEYAISDFSIINSTDEVIAERLKQFLNAARSLNKAFLTQEKGLDITTNLEFNRNWGFGSSSTLIALIAGWSDTDPLQLHRIVSQGSGYDVACSLSDSPILYRLKQNVPEIEKIEFNPPFAGELFLVYLGAKQSTDIEVESFRKKSGVDFSGEIDSISRISKQLTTVQFIEPFISLLEEHELIIGGMLGRKPVKDYLFSDFRGIVKSLGAWGGDFVLAASAFGGDYISDYFIKKSFNIVVPFNNLVHSGKRIKKTV